MRKSEKTRIILIIMTVTCIIFLAGNIFLMLAGLRVNSQIAKVSEKEEELQTELKTIKEDKTAETAKIEEDKAQIEKETQAEEESEAEEEAQAEEEVQTEDEAQMQELQESAALMDEENEGN